MTVVTCVHPVIVTVTVVVSAGDQTRQCVHLLVCSLHSPDEFHGRSSSCIENFKLFSIKFTALSSSALVAAKAANSSTVGPLRK